MEIKEKISSSKQHLGDSIIVGIMQTIWVFIEWTKKFKNKVTVEN